MDRAARYYNPLSGIWGGALAAASTTHSCFYAMSFYEDARSQVGTVRSGERQSLEHRQLSGWGLEFGHSPSARRVMFIDGRRNQGHPPSGGPCQSLEIRDA